jgi:RNA polymerase sigma-70 factor (ECF subfamily)
LQEAYIDALRRLPHYVASPDYPFLVWARAVTMQRLIDTHRQHLRSRARDAAREVRLGVGGGASIEASSERMAELIGGLSSPSVVAQRGEVVARVREALDRLDPLDREVLALRHMEEMSNLEVAETLGIRPAAASKRYVRVLGRLRDVLEGPTGDIEGRE